MDTVTALAWIGTGVCDPDKNLKQTLITIAVIVGWGAIIYFLDRMRKSQQSTKIKIFIITSVFVAAALLTFFVYAVTLIAFACARYE